MIAFVDDSSIRLSGRSPGGRRKPVSYLAGYRQFRTTDRAVAEAETAKLIAPHRLGLSSPTHRIDAALSWASLGSVAVFSIEYRASVSIDGPPLPDYMAVAMPVAGDAHVRHLGQEFVARPAGRQAVSWGDSVHMEFNAECTVLALLAEIPALTETLRSLAPDAMEPLRFESAVVNPRSREAVSGTMQMIVSVLDGYGSVEAVPAQLRRQLREHALNTILLTVPHNHSARIFRTRPPSRRVVREAIDLVENEAAGELTVSDIAKHVGVGVRALELGFKSELQCTPRVFLRTKRLEGAHRDLVDADPSNGATVTDIALRWGFAHAGRFATFYRSRYGIVPSQTLRNLSLSS